MRNVPRQLLAREIHWLWQAETQIVPVVVGVLGTVSKQLPGYLYSIGITSYWSVAELQKNALLKKDPWLGSYPA